MRFHPFCMDLQAGRQVASFSLQGAYTYWRLAVAQMGTAASLRQLGLQARLRCPSCETTYEHPQEGSPREGLQVSK
jgi:hypothetical protein